MDPSADQGTAVPAPSLVSIVVASLNCGKTMRCRLDSIFGQSYQCREIIVIDGGSTDGTQEILREAASRLTHWRSEPDRGICDAWNKGLQAARGEWICFIGADDQLADPQALTALAS